MINTLNAFIENADGDVSLSVYAPINDHIADLAAKNPVRLYGMASVYSGDAEQRMIAGENLLKLMGSHNRPAGRGRRQTHPSRAKPS